MVVWGVSISSWLMLRALATTAGTLSARQATPLDAAPHSTQRIEDSRYVSLGGIEQWITIRGDDDRNPILLLIHGGPGDTQSPFVSTYRPYERDYLLVQWDQRGAGRTFLRYGSATPELTLDRVAKDGIELALYLKSRFPGHRIVVLGHSWGTAIATEMVRTRPDLFAAYVGTGQIASWAESVQAQFDFLRMKARERHDTVLTAQLDSIGHPDPTNATQYFTFTRPLRRYLGAADSAWLRGLLDLIKHSPGLTDEDLKAIGDGMNFSGRTLLPTQIQERLSTEALRFELPYFVIQGREDMFTPTAPAVAYFDKVTAPTKRLVVLEGAGHFALATHPEAFVAALNELLAPITR